MTLVVGKAADAQLISYLPRPAGAVNRDEIGESQLTRFTSIWQSQFLLSASVPAALDEVFD
jgi:hypothetical protein